MADTTTAVGNAQRLHHDALRCRDVEETRHFWQSLARSKA
jgi:hypothetical protein